MFAFKGFDSWKEKKIFDMHIARTKYENLICQEKHVDTLLR